MKKLKYVCFLIFTLFCLTSRTQTNLVPNWSFEDTISCPKAQGYTFYSYTPPWFSCNRGTPDTYNTCSSDSHASVPSYGYGFQYPRTGNGFGGFCSLINSNSKEYLSVKLNQKLKGGNKYCISFYVNLINTAYVAIDAIGAYLSPDSLFFNNYTTIHVQPQIENPYGNVITDTLNWTLISGEYIANGGEQYITIGDFKDDSLNVVDTIPSGIEGAFYNLDDVSVFYCGEDTTGIKENDIKNTIGLIYPNPVADIANLDYSITSSTVELIIYSVVGEELFKYNLHMNDNKFLFSTDKLHSGIYFYKIISGNETISYNKFIIVK